MDTKILSNSKDITETILKFYINVINRCDGYGITTGSTLLNESAILEKIILNLKSKGVRIRYITEVTPENIRYCKKIMSNIELRHLDGVKGAMAVNDSEYITTATIGTGGGGGDGESGPHLFYSNGRQIVEQQQHVFDVLWEKATPAEQKILQIEKGLILEVVDIINDPLKTRDLYIGNLKSSTEELLLLFPSFNAFEIQKKLGLFNIIDYLLKIHKIKVKILLNYKSQFNNSVLNFLFHHQQQNNNISYRHLQKDIDEEKNTNTAIIIIDKKTLLILQLKEDYQESLENSIKFLVYSNNKSIVLSNALIFGSLWEHSELAKQFKQINEKLKTQEANLEKIIEIKTRDLRIANNNLRRSNMEISKKEEKFRKANENLIKAEKSKSEFVSMISHELKTPLVPIKGYTDMLLKHNLLGELNDKQRKALQTIYRNIEKQISLVDDILDVYKLEIGKLNISKKDTIIQELLTNVINDVKFMIEEKHISIVTEINTKTKKTVYCDEKRIEQVLLNLIKNSIDFVPQEGGKIVLSVEVEETERSFDTASDNTDIHSKMIFTVKDNGTKIPEDKVDSLFKKFYQVDSNNNRKYGGSGLGLAICKGIVESHGGSIWIDKNYSNGTSIKFSIPSFIDVEDFDTI